ncbi:MAG TPA: hypothetical protein VMC48_05990 [Methanobacterium sp.]|nr:hypothetical protein [Methanobacterium sp.]
MSEIPTSEVNDLPENEINEDTSPEGLSEIPKPVLKIKSRDGDINIVGKYKGEVSIKPINLKFIMATLWWEKAPELETFFNVLELTIKRALQEVYPHHKLSMDYIYTANDALEDASEIVVEIERLNADETEVQVEGDSIILMGADDRGFLKKITSFRRKVSKEIHKEL